MPDILPNNLTFLGCNNNNLNDLPNYSLEKINYNRNPIFDFIKTYHNSDLNKYIKWKKKYKSIANKIGNWFIKCKYDPSYKYCRDRLNKEYNSLYNIK